MGIRIYTHDFCLDCGTLDLMVVKAGEKYSYIPFGII
jgi:hypothetical protein